MLKKCVLLLAAISILFALYGIAHAEDSYSGGIGQIPSPLNDSKISMDSGVISILLDRDFAEVDCAYRLKNPDASNTIELIAPNSNVVNLHVYSGGVEITTTPSTPLAHKIQFGDKEEKIVAYRYLVSYGGHISPAESFMTVFTHLMEIEKSWKKPVNMMKVYVRFNGGLSWSDFAPSRQAYESVNYSIPESYTIKPAGYVRLPEGLAWTLKNMELEKDQDNISLVFFKDLNKADLKQISVTSNSTFIKGLESYPPLYLLDGDIQTAWGSAEKFSKKPYLKFDIKEKQEIAEVRILPGYVKSIDQFTKYARPKDITIRFSSGRYKRATLLDEPYIQSFGLDATETASSLYITVDSFYPGTESNSVFISEVVLAPSKTPFNPCSATLLSRIKPGPAKSSYVRMRTDKSSNKVSDRLADLAILTKFLNNKAVNILGMALLILIILLLIGRYSGMEHED